MNDVPRSIRFPQKLWDQIDRDAIRCKRSSVKQMEAVLTEYYELASVDLNGTALKELKSDKRVLATSINLEGKTKHRKTG